MKKPEILFNISYLRRVLIYTLSILLPSLVVAVQDGQEYYEKGRHYQSGLTNHPKDLIKACDLFEKSAELENKYGLYAFGMCNYLGQGRKININSGLNLLEMASNKGYYAANFELAWIYLYDFNDKELYEDAFDLLSREENENHSYSQLILGTLYYQGKGIKKSQSKALEYYIKAAGMDHKSAQVLLSEIYSKGLYGELVDLDKSNFYKNLTKSSTALESKPLSDEEYSLQVSKFRKWGWLPDCE